MAGFRLVGVMAMVCWLAEIVAVASVPSGVTGTGARGEPGAGSPVDGEEPDGGTEDAVDAQESSGSDSEGRARELQRQAAGHEETELRRADAEREQRAGREAARRLEQDRQTEASKRQEEERERQRAHDARVAEIAVGKARQDMAEEAQREVERRVEERRLSWLAQAGAEAEAAPVILQLASQLAAILESQRDTQITMMHVLEGLQGQREAERRMLGGLNEGFQCIQGMVGRELGAELASRGRSQAPVRGRSQAPMRGGSPGPMRGRSPAPATPSGAKGPTVQRCMICDNCRYRDKHPTSRRPCLRPGGELPPQRTKTDVRPEVKPKLNTRSDLLSSLDSDSQEAKKKKRRKRRPTTEAPEYTPLGGGGGHDPGSDEGSGPRIRMVEGRVVLA